MKITREELAGSDVDDILARQAEEAAGRAGSDAIRSGPHDSSIIHKSWFNLMIAGAVGAFAAWAIIEPYFVDTESTEVETAAVLLFPTVAALAGVMIGGMEGFLARNYGRALKGAGAGLVVGFAGGFIALFLAGILTIASATAIVAIIGEQAAMNPTQSMAGFIALMIVRSLAWGAAGMTAGLGPGIALGSGRLFLNGLLGGMIGGLIGGLLFDPINFIVSQGTFETGAESSRAIGFTIIGASAGIMIGLVELITRDAWLLMTAGPLKGKQFTVFKNPMLIGSSPKCDVYLFKDAAIEPFHAAVHTIRDGYELEDQSTTTGVFVNGARVTRHRLCEGDNIRIGGVQFAYSERDKIRQ